jgi:uncharacterized glyoxalase superfamily protein PhnB/uncharacterized protein YndB with AHSA1/START domain
LKIELSEVINRPPAVVFRFIAVEHVKNHPRWDPKMELQQLTEGPIGVGTVIRRRQTHTGAPVEGTMEVVEFVPDHAFGMTIIDGATTMHSRMLFQPEADDRTRIIASLDIPSMAETMDPSPIQHSLHRTKELIESEALMQNPPAGYQVVSPYLLYEDAAAAIEYLANAFGFEQRLAQTGAAGRTHYEVVLGEDGLVMIGQASESFRSPRSLGIYPPSLVHVYVNNVDALHERAKAAGADVTDLETAPVGDRRFTATDPEGQIWVFSQRVA